MTPHLVVVGSLNMDFVVSIERFPAPGETVLGSDFRMIPGGKGANQACAAGKLGSPGMATRMIGRVGYDVFGDQLKASLSAAGVDVSSVHASRAHATGVALITVDRAAQNAIVVASGANHALSAGEVPGLRTVFRGAACALFQLESPLEAVEAALRLAREEGSRTILDPAPAHAEIPRLLGLVDFLTPNESEACLLLDRPPTRISKEEAPSVARQLLKRGPRSVILKLGELGAFYSDGANELFSPAFAVQAIDTTAAGDIFNAGFAVALAEGKSTGDALRFANAAAAISVTRAGAQSSVPSRADVEAFLATA